MIDTILMNYEFMLTYLFYPGIDLSRQELNQHAKVDVLCISILKGWV